MSLDKVEIKKIAWLARLGIAEESIQNYSSDLSNILTLVEQMKSVDTKGIESLSHPLQLKARLRSDTITEENQREQFQAEAPLTQDGCYLVPKVIE